MKRIVAILSAGVLLAPALAFGAPVPKHAAKPTPKPTPTPKMMVAPFVLPLLKNCHIQFPKNTTALLNDGRGTIMLPVGSSNVALHKPVASSDEHPSQGNLAMVTDGDKDGDEGYWVELGQGSQWVQVDLQCEFTIHGVLHWHYWCEGGVCHDVIIQLSDDAAFSKNVRTVYNNDQDNTSGFGKGTDREFYERREGKWIPIKAQKARYVRLYSNGSTSDPYNHYFEVEVWATAEKVKPSPAAKPAPAKSGGKAATKFAVPSPKMLDVETMAKKSEDAQRKTMTNMPVELPKATKTPPPGMMVVPFLLPAPIYYSGPSHRPDSSRTTAPDPSTFIRRGPIYLPKGSANVAPRKPVTSSDDAPIIGTLSLITDGEKGAEEGRWIELGPGTQWVQIDLQKSFDIHGVLLWHYHGEPRVYRDVIVQLADDAEFMKNVRTVFNNDTDNSSGLGIGKDREYYESRQGGWIPIKAQKARYVRLYSRGNTSDPQNQYVEVEVWATAGK